MRKVAQDLEGFQFREGQEIYRWFQVDVGDKVVYVLFSV